jgi:hypothetical protein
MRLGAPALLLNHFETSPGRASQVTRATRDGDPPEPASAAAPAGGQAGGPKPSDARDAGQRPTGSGISRRPGRQSSRRPKANTG